MKYKMAGNRVSPQTRRWFTLSCLVALFVIFWCWEPFLGGEIASPLWTVLMIVLTVVFAAGNIWLGRDDLVGAGASPAWYWTKTAIKIVLSVIAIILLVIAMRNAAGTRAAERALEEEPGPAVVVDDGGEEPGEVSLSDLPTVMEPVE